MNVSFVNEPSKPGNGIPNAGTVNLTGQGVFACQMPLILEFRENREAKATEIFMIETDTPPEWRHLIG